MAERKEYKFQFDPDKIDTLSRVFRQSKPDKLIESLLELAYHHYVEEEDELVPGKLLRSRTQELEAQLEQLNRKLSAMASSTILQDNALCPKCYCKIGYDTVSRDYTCEKCGWEGPPEEVVRRPGQATPRS